METICVAEMHLVLARVKTETWQCDCYDCKKAKKENLDSQITKRRELAVLMNLLLEQASPRTSGEALQAGDWYIDSLIKEMRTVLLLKIQSGEFIPPKKVGESNDTLKGD